MIKIAILDEKKEIIKMARERLIKKTNEYHCLLIFFSGSDQFGSSEKESRSDIKSILTLENYLLG